MGQNGSDATLDMANEALDISSPYSPGSSLSDGIFDPPSPGNFNNSPTANATSNKNSTPKGKNEKKDAFDSLFGLSPVTKTINKVRSKKTIEKKKKCMYAYVVFLKIFISIKLFILNLATNPKVGVRMDENQLQILDDLPSSAVEMQVKDKVR